MPAVKSTVKQLWNTIEMLMDIDDDILDIHDPEALAAFSNYLKAVAELRRHLHGDE